MKARKASIVLILLVVLLSGCKLNAPASPSPSTALEMPSPVPIETIAPSQSPSPSPSPVPSVSPQLYIPLKQEYTKKIKDKVTILKIESLFNKGINVYNAFYAALDKKDEIKISTVKYLEIVGPLSNELNAFVLTRGGEKNETIDGYIIIILRPLRELQTITDDATRETIDGTEYCILDPVKLAETKLGFEENAKNYFILPKS